MYPIEKFEYQKVDINRIEGRVFSDPKVDLAKSDSGNIASNFSMQSQTTTLQGIVTALKNGNFAIKN